MLCLSSLRCFVNGIALIFFLFLLAFLSERMKIVVKEIGRHYYSADWNCWWTWTVHEHTIDGWFSLRYLKLRFLCYLIAFRVTLFFLINFCYFQLKNCRSLVHHSFAYYYVRTSTKWFFFVFFNYFFIWNVKSQCDCRQLSALAQLLVINC